MTRIGIIGSGPTGIYTLKGLIGAGRPLFIAVFERGSDAGKGTPYHPHMNDQAMLANIASVELPPVCETLVAWLRRQPDEELLRLNVRRENIGEREFYPRIVLGEFLQSQFRQLVEIGRSNGHAIDVRTNHHVVDIELGKDDIQLLVEDRLSDKQPYVFDHVVMATGHDWPETTEIQPGYFISPWPASILKTIEPCSVGILGTSLSAIDALVSVATAHGGFYLDPAGQTQYRAAPGSEAFRATMMSRKGILPEADFYCDYPYKPLRYCTAEAVEDLIGRGSAGLLDAVFDLFKREIVACDPDYAESIGLALVTVETLSPAYFAAREATDPFVWAATNLAEAEQNRANRITVQWRYAILRMHEIIAKAVPFLDEADLGRFQNHFKSVFVDDYATVPHQSIQRLLALRRAGRLEVLRLGKDYDIATKGAAHGAIVRIGAESVAFDAFIDATGQAAMSVREIPFPSLLRQGVFKPAATSESGVIIGSETDEIFTRTGGVDLDDRFRPKFEDNLCRELYCAAIAFLLHKMPFVQGITSANEIGGVVSESILDQSEGAGEQLLIQAEPAWADTGCNDTSSPTLTVPERSTVQ
jgi:uncharacterized NAD(P)/FAD-binding protein YdhS